MINPYTSSQLSDYQKQLTTVGSLSNLFSDSAAPMIYYRATENIYCKAFDAINVSRADCTADAIYNLTVGVGIKTFLDRVSGSFQKIAEFNKQTSLYSGLTGKSLACKIAELRNERIAFTKRLYGLKKMIYHCILRSEDGTISVFEEDMNSINIPNIQILETKPNKVVFTDGIERYQFYSPKSTLFKFFGPHTPFLSFKVDILEDPMEALSKLMEDSAVGTNYQVSTTIAEHKKKLPTLLVPLYSENNKRGRFVASKSGLNQWNAGGRRRDLNEIYIPYPKPLREDNAGFFPARYVPWTLLLPNHEVLEMHICQEDGKAIMSNPNKALGRWLLRDVLHAKEGTVLTYDDLIAKGINAILFTKISETVFSCDFVESDSLSIESSDDFIDQ